MVVHYVEVHQVGAGANHRVHFSAEARKSADNMDGAIQGVAMGFSLREGRLQRMPREARTSS